MLFLRDQPFRQLIYLSFVVVFSASLYYDFSYQPRLGHSWYLYKAVMLTNLNFILITIHSSVQFINSVINSEKLQAKIDYLFYAVLFPVAFTTVFMYWALYAFDPDFVMPEWIRKLIPEWLNQVTHTLPLVYAVADIFLTRHNSPAWKVLFANAVATTSFYWAIVFFVRHQYGYWLYPIFDLLSTEWWAVVIVLVVFLIFLDMSLAVTLSFVCWGKQPPSKSSKQKRKHY